MNREIVFQLQTDGVHMIYRTDTFSGAMPLTGLILNQPELLAEAFQKISRDPSLNKLVETIRKVTKPLEQESL
jgi:hypothetical protein